jgi:hypothetical protein
MVGWINTRPVQKKPNTDRQRSTAFVPFKISGRNPKTVALTVLLFIIIQLYRCHCWDTQRTITMSSPGSNASTSNSDNSGSSQQAETEDLRFVLDALKRNNYRSAKSLGGLPQILLLVPMSVY